MNLILAITSHNILVSKSEEKGVEQEGRRGDKWERNYPAALSPIVYSTQQHSTVLLPHPWIQQLII